MGVKALSDQYLKINPLLTLPLMIQLSQLRWFFLFPQSIAISLLFWRSKTQSFFLISALLAVGPYQNVVNPTRFLDAIRNYATMALSVASF